MAVFNGFPASYQNPYYAPQVPQPVQAQNNQNNSIIWVQGEAGAKSYLVAPNSTVQLWDSEEQVIYLKSADASGMPSMKIIDYTIRGTDSPVNAFSASNDKELLNTELSEIRGKIATLEDEIKKMKPKKKKADEEEE